MQILIDQAVYDMRNKGNVALLQVEVDRLHKLFPDATLQVLTSAPHVLKLYCPDAYPVRFDGQHLQSINYNRLNRFHKLVPRRALQFFLESREELQYRSFALASGRAYRALKSRMHGEVRRQSSDLKTGESAETTRDMRDTVAPEMLSGVDLFVGGGGGYMTDSDKPYAIRVLSRLEAAANQGIPTIMLGQGVGSITDQELRAKASAVLPLVDLILVREKRIAPQLLCSLGVDPSRIVVTGDDAVELAYNARFAKWGTGIGVSIRIAHYTDIKGNQVEQVKPALQRAARKHLAPLIALPIGCNVVEADGEYIAKLLVGYRKVKNDRRRFELPIEIIRKVRLCRIVIAGAYHAAVVALAQGVPVISLVKSVEYIDKFQSLAEEFKVGCQLIRVDDSQFEVKLATAIEDAWNTAEQLRPQLLSSAVRQIEAGRDVFSRIHDLVAARAT